jgi:5S rRNA maturation endonuclease (ribonuclease M5)
LSTHLKEKEEKIQQVLKHLAEDSAKGIPIIVEGKNDVETLRTLGIEGRIITAKTGGKTLLDVLSEVEESNVPEVIVLLDFDRRGREWTKRVQQHLEKQRIKGNIKFWLEILALAGAEVKDVEGLASYVETLKRKTSNS